MPSTEYVLQVQEPHVKVTSEDVQQVDRFFHRGHSNNSARDELLLDISRILRPFVKIKKDNHESIAVLIRMLTASRTIDEARAYLKLEEGTKWLLQYRTPKALAGASDMTNTARALQNPTITVADPDPVIFKNGDIENPLRHVGLPTETLADLLEGLPNTAGPFGTVEVGVSPIAQPLLPESASRSSAHSHTRSDVSSDFSVEPCPICHQIHLSMIMSMLQVLEQHGYDVNGPSPSSVASRRQSRRARSDRATPSMNAVPKRSIAAGEQHSSASIRVPPRRQQRIGPNAVVVVSLGVLVWVIVFLDVLPRLLSKYIWILTWSWKISKTFWHLWSRRRPGS